MIENVSTQLTVFHCFAHCLLPGRAFASLYVLLFLEKEAEIGGHDQADGQSVKLSNKIMVNSWMGDPMVCLFQLDYFSRWNFFVNPF